MPYRWVSPICPASSNLILARPVPSVVTRYSPGDPSVPAACPITPYSVILSDAGPRYKLNPTRLAPTKPGQFAAANPAAVTASMELRQPGLPAREAGRAIRTRPANLDVVNPAYRIRTITTDTGLDTDQPVADPAVVPPYH